MEVKEAIEFLETFKDKVTDIDMENGDAEMIEEYNNEIDKVIFLLQQGEKCRSDFTILVGRWDELFEENKINKKYRLMWEELKKDSYGCEAWWSKYGLMRYEQKYFPKEAKSDES